ncbi:hypothetical protein CROQUDRAFT_102652 [Cronartium quercuum f. sp. fusiforme G11]|uniref:Uncharacterized protein n=1 Tax=Cronartium quercuum f. sp. fusiforme G11 TaxID=708437 RepID=A0A9P6T4S3_9BASI|nr:hypothetical protein CROQUDRAFT_102652 [Cronartium quercuum f. sp. fusiforme G11]
MLGEANMGSIKTIFKELILMLKDMPTGGYSILDLSLRATCLTSKQPGSFLCKKAGFHDAVTLAEYGLWLASQASPPLSNPLDTVLASVLARVQAVEAKVDALLLDSANKAAAPPTPAPAPAPKEQSFASVTKMGARNMYPAKKQTPTAPKLLVPAKFPTISLIQSTCDRASFMQITSDPVKLRESINRSLAAELLIQHPTGPPKVIVHALACNCFTGEIQVQFLTQEEVDIINSLPTTSWVKEVDPGLQLKVEICPIIVHAIPTSFDPTNLDHMSTLMESHLGKPAIHRDQEIPLLINPPPH